MDKLRHAVVKGQLPSDSGIFHQLFMMPFSLFLRLPDYENDWLQKCLRIYTVLYLIAIFQCPQFTYSWNRDSHVDL